MCDISRCSEYHTLEVSCTGTNNRNGIIIIRNILAYLSKETCETKLWALSEAEQRYSEVYCGLRQHVPRSARNTFIRPRRKPCLRVNI